MNHWYNGPWFTVYLNVCNSATLLHNSTIVTACYNTISNKWTIFTQNCENINRQWKVDKKNIIVAVHKIIHTQSSWNSQGMKPC